MELPTNILEENKKTEAAIRKTEMQEEIRVLKEEIHRTGKSAFLELDTSEETARTTER